MNPVVGTNGEGRDRGDGKPARRKTPWALVVVAVLFVVAPFLAWYGTWFGRGLSDDKMEEYFSEGGNARHVQHALSQVAELIEKGEAGAAERWYPRVAEASGNGAADVRMTAAWVMGLEHRREEFHAALLRLLEDPEPIVRRNAALALVRFGDDRSRGELLAMLRPHAVRAESAGRAQAVLSEGTTVKRGMMMTRVKLDERRIEEVRAALPGKIIRASVREGDEVGRGAELFILSPDSGHARDALIGLYYFGRAEDLQEIERYASGVEGVPEDVRKQAAATAEAVRRRASQSR